MEAAAIIAIVEGLVGAAMRIWSSARKVLGTEAIPSWEDIIEKNKKLQDKIDAEL